MSLDHFTVDRGVVTETPKRGNAIVGLFWVLAAYGVAAVVIGLVALSIACGQVIP